MNYIVHLANIYQPPNHSFLGVGEGKVVIHYISRIALCCPSIVLDNEPFWFKIGIDFNHFVMKSKSGHGCYKSGLKTKLKNYIFLVRDISRVRAQRAATVYFAE